MKRILMFIDSIGYNGGAERQFCGLAQLLSKNGYDVHVVAYHPQQGYREEMEKSGVKVYIEHFGQSQIQKIIGACRLFKKIAPEAVISYKNGSNVISCILKAIGGKWKLIVSDRNTVQQTNLNIKTQYILYRFADIIVSNSHSQKNFINVNYPNLINKTVVITNFTDCNKFRPNPSFKKNDCTKRIIAVGRIHQQKNVLNFIRAVASAKEKTNIDFVIDWYGADTGNGYLQKCMNLIEELGIQTIFHFKGKNLNIEYEYPHYDCFCLPSIYEGFPNVVCEAMACGLPAIASNICDNNLIIDDGTNGWTFNPLSVDDMTDKICKINDTPKQDLSNMGILAREKIKE